MDVDDGGAGAFGGTGVVKRGNIDVRVPDFVANGLVRALDAVLEIACCSSPLSPLPPPLPSPCSVQLRLTTKANGGVEKKNMKKNQFDRHLTGNPACAPQRCPRTEAQPHNLLRSAVPALKRNLTILSAQCN